MEKCTVSLFKKSPILLFSIVVLLIGQTLVTAAEKKNPSPAIASGTTKSIPPSLASSKQKLKTIIVDNYYPYTFVNPNGQPDGFSVDIIKAVTKVMEMDLTIQVGPWDKAMKALEKGEIDLLPMMAYSQERDRTFDFSTPHTIAYDAVFIRKGSPKITNLETLKDKSIIVMKDDAAHGYLRSIGMTEKAKMILVDSLPEALQLLSSGKGDLALMPKLVGIIVINRLGLTNLNTALVIETYNRPFSFAVKHGNQNLLESLTQGLSIVKATGQYTAIYSKWFGALEPPGLSTKTVMKYIGLVIGFFLIIGLILFFWSLSLKKQVALRTRKLELEIEERKEVEDSLRQSEDRFRTLVEQAPDAITVYDVDQDRLVEANSNAEKLFGCSREELLMSGIWRFYAPVQPDGRPPEESIPENIKRTLEGEQLIFERAIRNSQDQDLICEVRLTVLPSTTHKLIRNSFIDITERKRAEDQIRASLKEKEVMLREIHHRVKNNLQLIQSLLNLQRGKLEDPRIHEVFKESQDRIRSMALVHEKLYQSQDFSHIDMADYLRKLCSRLFHSYHIKPDKVTLKLEVEEVPVGIDKAVSLGLILNELISNALKHAFPGEREGEIRVGLALVEGEMIRLTVVDNGIGFPEEVDFRESESMGFYLVTALVEQLDGTIELLREVGTEFRITFPETKVV